MTSMTLRALDGIPLVAPGDDLARLTIEAVAASGERLLDGDLLVYAQKIVSKAEGRSISLAEVVPSPAAIELARVADKDPRLAELILRESEEVLRVRPGVVIVRHR